MLRLRNELETIDVLNRLREYNPNSGDDEIYFARQARRSEILAEMAKLEAQAPQLKSRGLAGGVASLLGATAYTTFHYLLRFHHLLK